MAQVFEGGNGTFDALAYGSVHPSTQEFIHQQMASASHALTDSGARFFESAKEIYNKIQNSSAARLARAAGRKVRSIWQREEIRELKDVGELQHAPLMMQRYVMAEPTIRRWWQKGRLDGYSDTYFDADPGHVGENHYEYRRVTNSIVFMDEENDSWHANTYLDELFDDDEELSIDEQSDILTSWEVAKNEILYGRSDPTSKFNADL